MTGHRSERIRRNRDSPRYGLEPTYPAAQSSNKDPDRFFRSIIFDVNWISRSISIAPRMCFSLKPAFLFSLLFKETWPFHRRGTKCVAGRGIIFGSRLPPIEGVGSLILDFTIHKYMYAPTKEDLHMDG
jgi:hypothetical protein